MGGAGDDRTPNPGDGRAVKIAEYRRAELKHTHTPIHAYTHRETGKAIGCPFSVQHKAMVVCPYSKVYNLFHNVGCFVFSYVVFLYLRILSAEVDGPPIQNAGLSMYASMQNGKQICN